MNVDDAGRRAAAALRDRFDRLPAPPLAETTPRRPRSGHTAVFTGVAAVLLIALLVAIVAPWREPDGPAGPGGTWKRIDQRTAFGRNASPSVITTWRGRLIALGSQRISKEPPRSRPAFWRSDDGEHWDRVDVDHIPGGDFWGFSTVATRGDVIAASISNNGQIWRSTDARTWRRVVDARFHRGTTYFVQRAGGRFVATDVDGPGYAGVALTSRDALRWRKDRGSAEGERAVGLPVGARLGRHWITLGIQPTYQAAPPILRSEDAVRWDPLPGASPPVRLALPLVSNRARSRVLGIDFEPQGAFGGRLFSSSDGAKWTEIPSFHAQMPVANPDHLVPAGRWWVLGGNRGTPDGKRRASMWVTPDLRRWYEMPARLRGEKNDGVGMLLVEQGGRVIGKAGHSLWVWTPPE